MRSDSGGLFATLLFYAVVLVIFCSGSASRGCARLPAGGRDSAAQCVRFDSFSAGIDSAFTCATLSSDSLHPNDWTLGPRPVGERRCSDWDGSATDTGCAQLEPLAWRDVVFVLVSSSIHRLPYVELWHKGEVADAPLLVVEATGELHSETEHWATLFSAHYVAVNPDINSTLFYLALKLRRACALVSWTTFPNARFYVWLHDDVSVFPENLLSLLRTAEDAFGTAQAYELGSAECALPWRGPYGFGHGAAGGVFALSRIAAQRLADSLANGTAALTNCAAVMQDIKAAQQSKVLDAVVTCALRRAGIITVHCGHFMTHAHAYTRPHQSNASEPEGTLPLPGNPATILGTSHLSAGSKLCMLPGSVGDPYCLSVYHSLARLELSARALAVRSEADEVHAILSRAGGPEQL